MIEINKQEFDKLCKCKNLEVFPIILDHCEENMCDGDQIYVIQYPGYAKGKLTFSSSDCCICGKYTYIVKLHAYLLCLLTHSIYMHIVCM